MTTNGRTSWRSCPREWKAHRRREGNSPRGASRGRKHHAVFPIYDRISTGSPRAAVDRRRSTPHRRAAPRLRRSHPTPSPTQCHTAGAQPTACQGSAQRTTPRLRSSSSPPHYRPGRQAKRGELRRVQGVRPATPRPLQAAHRHRTAARSEPTRVRMIPSTRHFRYDRHGWEAPQPCNRTQSLKKNRRSHRR